MRLQLSFNTLTGNILNSRDVSDLGHDDQRLNQWLTLVACEQDKTAFTRLFKHFSPKIRAYGLQRFKQEAAAMELVQETMTLVWRKAALYNSDKGKASTWIYTVMRNYCFDMLRKQQHQKEETVSELLWPLFTSADSFAEPDHLLARLLLANIDSLPKQQQQVVEGVYLKEMTQQELAQNMGVPLGTVKSRLRLAITKLKEKLENDHD
jgi:RNA polymerase sigma-70 factor (ECF subfamily)